MSTTALFLLAAAAFSLSVALTVADAAAFNARRRSRRITPPLAEVMTVADLQRAARRVHSAGPVPTPEATDGERS